MSTDQFTRQYREA